MIYLERLKLATKTNKNLDWFTELILELVTRAEAAEAELDTVKKALADPTNVHAFMLSGRIAKISWRQHCHLTGEVLNGEEVQLAEIVRLRERVMELECTVCDLSVGVTPELDAAEEKVRELEAVLERVKGLVEKWRKSTSSTYAGWVAGWLCAEANCADELQAKLKGE